MPLLVILACSVVFILLIGLFVIGAGIDLVLYLLSAIFPFVLCLVGIFAAVVIVGLAEKHCRSKKIKHIIGKYGYAATIAAGLLTFVLFMYGPRNALPFSTGDIATVTFYNLRTGSVTDYVDSPERLEEVRDILDDLHMHYHHAKRIPDYLSSLGKVDITMSIGVFDKSAKKLVEINFTDTKLIGVYYPEKDKEVVYELYRKPDLDRLDAIRKTETSERTKNRIIRDNGDWIQRCLDGIVYENGELIVSLQNLAFQEELRLTVDAVVQSLKLSYTYEDIELLETAGMSDRYDSGDIVRIPVPDRKYRELKIELSLDGIRYSRDAADLLPEEMLTKK